MKTEPNENYRLMLFHYINAQIISKVLLTYDIVENNILYHALYLQPLKSTENYFYEKFLFFFL